MTGNLLASGIGILVPQLDQVYNNDPRVSDLVTWPAFYMGLGNLIAMPIADAIGRRPVYLFSNAILIAGSIWCSYSDSLGSHIGGRDFMALAAGQSEALCVLIAEVFCVPGLLSLNIINRTNGHRKPSSYTSEVTESHGFAPCRPWEPLSSLSPVRISALIWVGAGGMEFSPS